MTCESPLVNNALIVCSWISLITNLLVDHIHHFCRKGNLNSLRAGNSGPLSVDYEQENESVTMLEARRSISSRSCDSNSPAWQRDPASPVPSKACLNELDPRPLPILVKLFNPTGRALLHILIYWSGVSSCELLVSCYSWPITSKYCTRSLEFTKCFQPPFFPKKYNKSAHNLNTI